MNRNEYTTAQHQLITLCQFARLLPAEEMLRAQERADAMGPFQDPTLYQRALHDPAQGWDTIKRLTRAAAKFKREVEDVLGPPDKIVSTGKPCASCGGTETIECQETGQEHPCPECVGR